MVAQAVVVVVVYRRGRHFRFFVSPNAKKAAQPQNAPGRAGLGKGQSCSFPQRAYTPLTPESK